MMVGHVGKILWRMMLENVLHLLQKRVNIIW